MFILPSTSVAFTALAPGGLASHVLARYHGAQLTATLRRKPTSLAPTLLQPVVRPQLIVQLSGTARMLLTRQGRQCTYDVQPGSLFLNTAQQGSYELAWQAQRTEALVSLELEVAPALLGQTAAAAGFDADHLTLHPGANLTDPLLYQLGASLAATLQAPLPADNLYLEALTHLLATHLVHRHCAPAPARLPGLPARRLRELAEFVQDSLDQEITLAQLAGIACLSPYHFCRVFRQATGQSPQQYVLMLRLSRAQHLLQHTALPVAQVARAVGYRSASHFARLFRRHMGVFPTELRGRGATGGSRRKLL